MSTPYDHDSAGRVEFGETHVSVYPAASNSAALTAHILGRTNGEDGRPDHVVLDRRIHNKDTVRFDDYVVYGVFVTELVRIGREKLYL